MIIINPGSGPVDGATKENAELNMEALAADLIARGQDAAVLAPPLVDRGDGRWHGYLDVDGRTYDIDMPGLPLERVRYLGEPGQDIWDFPRLYVNGSSWAWEFALGVFTPDDAP